MPNQPQRSRIVRKILAETVAPDRHTYVCAGIVADRLSLAVSGEGSRRSQGLPVTIVMAKTDGAAKRALLDEAEAEFASDHQDAAVMDAGRAEKVIPQVAANTSKAQLLMGAWPFTAEADVHRLHHHGNDSHRQGPGVAGALTCR